MRSPIAILAVLSLFATVFVSTPAHLHGQQPSQAQHDQHHPTTPEQAVQPQSDRQASMMKMMAKMHENDQKLDELVKKMNAANGSAKVDAIAELLTALVQDRRTLHDSMSNMSMMMNMMGAMHGRSDTPPKQ